MICQNHIEGYVVRLPNKSKFIEYDFCEFHIPYMVKCSCGCEEFRVYKNDLPNVYVVCESCKLKITVYDLNHYPCASIVPCDDEPSQFVSQEDEKVFNVCVIYEYSDEFAFDENEFDPNDITWCHVLAFGLNSHMVYEIINDETA